MHERKQQTAHRSGDSPREDDAHRPAERESRRPTDGDREEGYGKPTTGAQENRPCCRSGKNRDQGISD